MPSVRTFRPGTVVAATTVVVGVTLSGLAARPFSQKLSPDKQVIHVLNRLTFGPRLGDAAEVRRMGVAKWIDRQLHPETIPENPALTSKLASLTTLAAPTWDLMTRYPVVNVNLAATPLPSGVAMSALTVQQQSRIRNGSLEERKATLAALDPGTRRLVMVALSAGSPSALEGLPEEWIQEASDARRMEQEARQRELRRLMPPLTDLVTLEQLLVINQGTPEAKLALVNSFDPDKRRQLLRVFPPQQLNNLPPTLRREASSIREPQQFVNNELIEQKIYRAIESNRQLEEVLVDFWMNHFNVFNGKGQDRVLLTSYERDAIRPHVLGHFKDLLLATARHPAMLFYLDNWQSQVPRDDLPAPPPNVRRPGLNENYGREIMELHTLGVNGGYTQDDVVNVARAFTGWTIYDPQKFGEFQFNPAVHDRKEKVVLGHVIPAMGGEEDGLQVIDILAHHPSTALFISRKLAQRFVADMPPQALVDRMAATFTNTDGDLRAVLQTLFRSPEFLSEGAWRAKMKSPLEMVVSAIRATNADVTDAFALAQRIGELGQPLYGKLDPTGYPNTGDAWNNTASILGRINFSNALANGQIPGVTVSLDRFKARTPAEVAADLLAVPPAAPTMAALEEGLAGKPGATAQLVALVLGSPDFQRR